MRVDKIYYTCDDCKDNAIFKSYTKARGAGWAMSKDYTSCYCPECAPEHRRGGASGKPSRGRWLPNGFEQISIEEI